jgi:hypothetical protein
MARGQRAYYKRRRGEGEEKKKRSSSLILDDVDQGQSGMHYFTSSNYIPHRITGFLDFVHRLDSK